MINYFLKLYQLQIRKILNQNIKNKTSAKFLKSFEISKFHRNLEDYFVLFAILRRVIGSK